MSNKRKMVDDDDIEGYANIHRYHPVTVKRVAEKYRTILKDIGENPEREGLLKTPERVAKALHYLTHGYDLDPAEILRSAMFSEEYSQMRSEERRVGKECR